MTRSPLVSIIMPVHNTERYLEQCLDSVLNQSLKDIEVICIDDSSSDSSRSILDAIAAKDSRVTILTQDHKGAGAARNLGMQHAKGTYYSILDSDDFFELDMLAEAVTKARNTDADITVYGAWLYDEARNSNRQAHWILQTDLLPQAEVFSAEDIAPYLFNAFGNYTWNKLFKADFIKKNSITFQEISRTNDLLFTCSALAKASKISVIDRCFAHYRITNTTSLQTTNDRDPVSFIHAFQALYEFLETNSLIQEFETSYLNHFIDGICSNADSMRTISGLETILSEVKDSIEPSYQICSKKRDQIRSQAQLNQFESLAYDDTDTYLFKRFKMAQTQLEDSYWYTDWCEWQKWMAEVELNEKSEELDAIKERKAVKIANKLNSLLNR